MDHNKLEQLLEMLMYLSGGIKRSIPEIAERFNISERTVYRYIDTFKQAGFIVPPPVEGLFYISNDSPYFREIDELLHFSKEEAVILQKAIHSVSNENILKQNLINKLYALYDFDRVADTIVKQEYSQNIHNLIRAIKQKRKVVLKGYESANSQKKKDRIVEPFDFTTNYVATWAYDSNDGHCKTFKNARIDEVVILKDAWDNETNHELKCMDVFRNSGENQVLVKLELTIRACNLLMEEYPLAEPYIFCDNTNRYIFEAPLFGYKGIARFVMGLCEEVKIVAPQELKDYVKEKAKKMLIDTV